VLLAYSLASGAATLTTADYSRAERFLWWNAERYVINGDIQHHWIGNEDRFWYLRANAVGGREFIVVDANTGHETSAFGQKLVAASLSKATGKRIADDALPFTSFSFLGNGAAIQFSVNGTIWVCQLNGSGCIGGPQVEQKSGEVLSPDGRRAAYVKNHNLWLRDTASGRDMPLTADGEEDYDYATESSDSTHAVTDQRLGKTLTPQLIWSADSRHILTYRLDQRGVKPLYLMQSVTDDGTIRPKLYPYRYALPGDTDIATLRLLLIDAVAPQSKFLDVPPLLAYGDESLFNIHYAWWSDDGRKVYFLRRARFAKSISLNVVDSMTGQPREILQETASTPVRLSDDDTGIWSAPSIHVLKNGDVIWYSERDGWAHLYYYEGATGRLRNRITKGDWVVSRIVHVDEEQRRIFFLARGREPHEDPYQQHLYSVNFDGSAMRLLTPENAEHHVATRLQVRDAELAAFSPSGRYFVDTYSRPDLPPVLVLRRADGRRIRQLEQADISKLREGGYTPVEPFQVLAADERTAIYGNLFRPSGFVASKKYPIIDSNYPGPHCTRTSKSFTAALFHPFETQSLADLGFIVITIDGRGTPHRSKAFLDYSYGRMEKASDLEDHIAGIRQLAQRYPYMDVERVGIWGVSAGGFAAARAVLKYPDFYKVAVSAEANHDQRGEVGSWAETYMGPLDRQLYDEASNLSLAANLKGKLLLMHGDVDDNTPPFLTLRLVSNLIKANKDFDLLLIPNANHGAFTLPYFTRKKWDYFVRNLLGAEPPSGYEITQPPSVHDLF